MKNTNMNRRTFLKVTTIAGAGMLVGCSYQSNPNLSTPMAKTEDLGLFIRISKDNSITIISPTSEMGQGTHTAHAMIIAEELNAEWETSKWSPLTPFVLNTIQVPMYPQVVTVESECGGTGLQK